MSTMRALAAMGICALIYASGIAAGFLLGWHLRGRADGKSRAH